MESINTIDKVNIAGSFQIAKIRQEATKAKEKVVEQIELLQTFSNKEKEKLAEFTTKQIGLVQEQETKMRLEKENLHAKIIEFRAVLTTVSAERKAAENILADMRKTNMELHSALKRAHEAIQYPKQVCDDISTCCTSAKKVVVEKFGTTGTVGCSSSVASVTPIFPKVINVQQSESDEFEDDAVDKLIAGSVLTENIVAAEMLVSVSRAVNSDILGAKNNSSSS
jgi:hypothetical protein